VAGRKSQPLPPDTPPPELCQTAPRSFDELTAIAATAVVSPPASRTPGPVPEGTPADAETIAGITATVRELVACFNAGEPLRAYALHTDADLARIFAQQGPLTQAGYEALATPEPLSADEQAAILAIRGARLLADGSVGATVTLLYPRIPVPKTFFFTFVQAGDCWLIAGVLGETSFSVP
jgi:hypothetical protein